MKTKEQQEQTEKLRQHFVPTAVGIIILIISLTVVRPIFLNVFKMREENKQLQKRLLSLETKLADLKAIDEFQINQRVKTVERVFPSERPIVNLLFAFNKLAEETGVELGGVDMRPGKIVTKTKPQTEGKTKAPQEESKVGSSLQDFEITFDIKGEFSNISQFFNRLEKIAPLMRLEDTVLSFSSSKTEEKKEEKEEETIPVSRAAITVRVFYQSLPETLGSVDKPLPKFASYQEKIFNEISQFQIFEFKVVPMIVEGRSDPFRL